MLVCTAGSRPPLWSPHKRTSQRRGSFGNTSFLNSKMSTTVMGWPFSYLAEIPATEPITARSVMTCLMVSRSGLGEGTSPGELTDKATVRIGNQSERIVVLVCGKVLVPVQPLYRHILRRLTARRSLL